MEQHAGDLLRLMLWIAGGLGAAIVALGGLGVGVFRWAASALFKRLDVQDQEIGRTNNTLASIKDLLASEVGALREANNDARLEARRLIHAMDVRLTRVEERCVLQHPAPNHDRAVGGLPP